MQRGEREGKEREEKREGEREGDGLVWAQFFIAFPHTSNSKNVFLTPVVLSQMLLSLGVWTCYPNLAGLFQRQMDFISLVISIISLLGRRV